MKELLFIAVGLILLFAAQRECAADGSFFSTQDAKPPDMPQQRAIIVYRNGVERLIIESAFQGEAGDYAWIVPVPSEPLEIRKASYGLFKTMYYELGKQVVGESEGQWIPHLIILGFLALITLLWSSTLLNGKPWVFTVFATIIFAGICSAPLIFAGAWQALIPLAIIAPLFFLRKRLPRTAAITTYVLTILLIAGIAIPNLIGARGSSSGGASACVDILSTKTIGDYDVTTLKAHNADALDFWLATGGFQPLGPEGRRIAGDYIAEDWCFVAGKLRKTDNRLSAPHPIEISLKADAPVYPMRLTSLAGGPLYLDLIIVAESAYECPILETEFSNAFHDYRGPNTFTDFGMTANLRVLGIPLGDVHRGLEKAATHSEVRTLLWSGCVISKLSGTLTPADMTADIRPALGAPGKMQVLVTKEAATLLAMGFGICIFFVATLIATIILCFTSPARMLSFAKNGRLYLSILGLSMIIGLAIWMTVPTADVMSDRRMHASPDPGGVCASAFKAACSVPGGPAEKLMALYDERAQKWPEMNSEIKGLLSQLESTIEPALRKADVRNPVTREPITFEYSPGNLNISLDYNIRELSLSLLDVYQGYYHTRWICDFSAKGNPK
ncbi:MAG: DUF2330 domain-containing protein [Candidatus Brocadiia bacterium]